MANDLVSIIIRCCGTLFHWIRSTCIHQAGVAVVFSDIAYLPQAHKRFIRNDFITKMTLAKIYTKFAQMSPSIRGSGIFRQCVLTTRPLSGLKQNNYMVIDLESTFISCCGAWCIDYHLVMWSVVPWSSVIMHSSGRCGSGVFRQCVLTTSPQKIHTKWFHL